MPTRDELREAVHAAHEKTKKDLRELRSGSLPEAEKKAAIIAKRAEGRAAEEEARKAQREARLAALAPPSS